MKELLSESVGRVLDEASRVVRRFAFQLVINVSLMPDEDDDHGTLGAQILDDGDDRIH